MTSKHQPSIWEINKASAFIDAMNAAHHRPRHPAHHVEHHPWTQVKQDTPPEPKSGRPRHLIVTFISLAVVGGLVAANWIA